MRESCTSTKKLSDIASKTSHVINDVTLKKGDVLLLVDNKEITISTDSYLSDYFYPGKELDGKQYAELLKMEKQMKSRKYLLYLLSHGRYTTYEIKKRLKEKHSLSEKDCDEMIKPYVESGLLSDREYVVDYLESKTEQGYGKQYLISTLKRKGIPESMLKEKEIQSLMEENKEAVYTFLSKEDKKRKALSSKKRREVLMQCLYRRGFTSSQSQAMIDDYFSSMSLEERKKQEENSKMLLKKEALKCYNSFVRKYPDVKKRKQAFLQRFLRQGYEYSEIEELIQQEGLNFND